MSNEKHYTLCNNCGKQVLEEDCFNGKCLKCVDHYSNYDEPTKVDLENIIDSFDSDNWN